MNRFFRSALFPLVVIVLLVWVASQTLIPHSKSEKKATLSQFIALAKHRASTTSSSTRASTRSAVVTSQRRQKSTVHYPADQSVPEITRVLEDKNINFDSKGTGGFSWLARSSRCSRSSS